MLFADDPLSALRIIRSANDANNILTKEIVKILFADDPQSALRRMQIILKKLLKCCLRMIRNPHCGSSALLIIRSANEANNILTKKILKILFADNPQSALQMIRTADHPHCG